MYYTAIHQGCQQLSEKEGDQTHFNSRGPDATSTSQVLFALSCQNLPESHCTRPGLLRLDVSIPIFRKLHKPLDKFARALYNRRCFRQTTTKLHLLGAGHRKDLTSSL